MLIQALYEFFQRAKDDEDIDLEAGFGSENVNLKIVIDENGNFDSAVILESKSKSTNIPRTIRSKKGKEAEFLCDNIEAVFGLSQDFDKPKDDQEQLKKKNLDYWRQIETAFAETNHPWLRSLLEFRRIYLFEETPSFMVWKKAEEAKCLFVGSFLLARC